MNKLQELRKTKGLSQSQLAKISGISVRTLQNYETNHRNINNAQTSIINKIALALNCTIEEILNS